MIGINNNSLVSIHSYNLRELPRWTKDKRIWAAMIILGGGAAAYCYRESIKNRVSKVKETCQAWWNSLPSRRPGFGLYRPSGLCSPSRNRHRWSNDDDWNRSDSESSGRTRDRRTRFRDRQASRLRKIGNAKR